MDNTAPKSSAVPEPNDLWVPIPTKRESESYSENSDVETTAGNDPDEDNAFGVRVGGERPNSESGMEAVGGALPSGKVGCAAEDTEKKTNQRDPCRNVSGVEEGLRGRVPSDEEVELDGKSQVRQVEGKDKKRHLCEVCGRGFLCASALKTHWLVHTGEKPHACAKCGKRFSYARSLREHLLTHTGEKRHTCDFCGKGFTKAGELKKHRRVHTGEKPYSCDVCGERFSQTPVLKTHLLKHTGEKPHACAECGRRFSLAAILKTHLLTHTGEKRHNCDFCGKGFKRADSLKRHWRMHTGEKPYGCADCGKRFSDLGNMKAHLVTHTRQKIKTPMNSAERGAPGN